MSDWFLQAFPQIVLVAASALALGLLPGLAVVIVALKDMPLRRIEKLILAFGTGIALPPLLLEISHLIGLPWQRWMVLAYLGVFAPACL